MTFIAVILASVFCKVIAWSRALKRVFDPSTGTSNFESIYGSKYW